MKMTRLEKSFVNRSRKAARNVARLDERIRTLPVGSVEDVLELGCGTGEVSAHLSQRHGYNVIAADVDPEQIELARRSNPVHTRLRFEVEDATQLTFGDDSFDLVVAQNLFHHLPEWPRAVAEIRRVLRANGHLIWFDLVIPRPFRGVLARLAGRSGVYSLEEVSERFTQAGLIETFSEKVRHGPLTHHHLVLRKEPEPSAS